MNDTFKTENIKICVLLRTVVSCRIHVVEYETDCILYKFQIGSTSRIYVFKFLFYYSSHTKVHQESLT
jgi:hypothetical protein